MDTELEREPCQGEYPGIRQDPYAPLAPGSAHDTARQRWQPWNITQYLRRSQNMSMISKSDWTHKSREKSSN